MLSELDIPVLNPELQGENLPCPVLPYGSVGRTIETGGTRHCYVDDARFDGLWARPDKLLLSGCSVVIEPNYSTSPDTPRWQALADVAKKRTLARYWQSFGIRIFVDLNVDPKFRDFVLLGVPRGWLAYATRSHRGFGFDAILADYRLACEHAETDRIRFALFGGGKAARRFAADSGWLWVPEQSHVARGLERPYHG